MCSPLLGSPAALPTIRRYGAVHKVKLQPAPGYLNTFQFGLVEMRSAAEAERARSALQVEWTGPRNAVLMDGWMQHALQLVLLRRSFLHRLPTVPALVVHPTHQPQGEEDEDICDSRPLKLRYGWPPRLVMRGGRLPAGQQQQQQQQQQPGAGEEVPPGFAGGGSSGGAARPAVPRCAVCGAREPEAALKRCSACRAVHYCSQQCQLKGWEAGHHEECARLKQLSGLLEAPAQQLPIGALRLLAAALQQPGRREGRMLQALLAQQQPAEVAATAAAGVGAVAAAGAATAAAADTVQGSADS